MTRRTRALALTLVLAVALHVEAAERWPPSLPARSTLPPALAAGVERVWSRPTITRHVEGERALAPLDLYAALIDAPEVTTAASRHLQLARYDVQRLGENRYRADDGAGARGEYEVLLRAGGRRVMFSRGSHTGRLLGTITGTALTDIHFEAREGHVAQRLTARVLIDHRVVAMFARVLVPLFGQVVDRKLQEGFRVTARVAEWAAAHPVEFCTWLGGQALAADVRQSVRSTVRGCRPPSGR